VRSRRPGSTVALAAPAVGWTLVLVAAPVAMMLFYGFLTGAYFAVSGPITLDNYRQALERGLTWTLVGNSMIVGVLTAAICIALAVPVACWLRYSAGRWQMPVLFVITTSMFASYLVRIYAWRTILGENGMVNTALKSLGLIDHPLGFLIFNRAGIVIAMVHIALPYVILVLYAALRPLDPAYLEAAADLGGGSWVRMRKLVLPVLAAPMVSAFLFVFVLASADYITPQFLGGPADSMVGVLIASDFQGTGDWAAGSALSGLLLVGYGICFAVATLGLRLSGASDVRWARS
jgi:ABC-type spermidine/putrescine transport system permease subunit I